jgi:four helix bundle protein
MSRKEANGMAHAIARFEDFIAWQKARSLTARIYAVTGKGGFTKDFGLRDQIRRASVSIMANIAEGFERGRPAEFHQYLSVAKASCAELRSHLYVALDAQYLSNEDFKVLKSEAEEVGRILGGLRASVQRRRDQ